MTEGRKRWDVFISHSSHDSEIAKRVCDTLRAAGWRPFLSSEHLNVEVGSAAWSRAIDEALDQSGVVLLLASAAALKSRWVEHEWRSKHDDILGGEDGMLIPVCFEQLGPRQLPRALRRYQAVDLRKASSFEAGLEQIGELLRGYLGGELQDRRLDEGTAPRTSASNASIDRIRDIILDNDPKLFYQVFDGDDIRFVFHHDTDLALVLSDRDDEPFDEPWIKAFPANALPPRPAKWADVRVTYAGTLLERFSFLYLDAGRYLLPLPQYREYDPDDLVVDETEAALGRIVEKSVMHGLDQGLAQAKISVVPEHPLSKPHWLRLPS